MVRRTWRTFQIRVFIYLFGEIVPQFISTVVIFSSVLIISQLIRLTELLVAIGLSFENIVLPIVFVAVPFLSLTIPMAFMFAVMLAFSRMSADGEVVALLASGYSLRKALLPLMIIATVLVGGGLAISTQLEAWGRREFLSFTYRKTQTEFDNIIRSKIQPGVFVDNFLGFVLHAEEVSNDKKEYKKLILSPQKRSGKFDGFTLSAPEGKIEGSVETGQLILTLKNGFGYSSKGESYRSFRFETMKIDLLRLFRDQIFGGDTLSNDYQSLPIFELRDYIKEQRKSAGTETPEFRKANYLFHKRFAAPFGTIVFFLFGLVFGISEQRRPKGTAYASCISVIIISYLLTVGFKWLAENGHMGAILASWGPHLLLLPFGIFMVYQRNRLPISEPVWAWRNLGLHRKQRQFRQ